MISNQYISITLWMYMTKFLLYEFFINFIILFELGALTFHQKPQKFNFKNVHY
jgi:hypothetical protein